LRAALVEFEADRWSGDDCASLAEELAATQKACAAASAAAAKRAVACNAHRSRGYTGGVEWVARTNGSTPSEARTALQVADALSSCPATNEAVKAGTLSLAQAREIASAEARVPGSEAELLEVAATTGMAGLREESRRVRLSAMDRDDLHAERQRVRSVTHGIDELGMVFGRFRLPPEVGLPFVNRLDRETDRVRRAARRAGNTETRDALAADAFVRMTAPPEGDDKAGKSGKRAPRPTRADVVFVCDLEAATRGHTHGDELCHVVGAGPVPVSVVREALVGAFVKVAIRDGKKLDTIVHYGRHLPAELRTALELGDPERLDGAVCSAAGCDRRYGLQWDHADPVANQGLTSYQNVGPLCPPDHWAKTERDRKAGLLNGRGKKRGPPG
jgi:hypothetical protein